MVIDDMISMFIDSRKRGTDGAKRKSSAKTLRIYERNLTIFRDFLQSEVSDGGITKYESVKRLHMRQFQDWVDAKVSRQEWSKATAIQLFGAMRTFFRWVPRDEDCQIAELVSYERWLPPIEKKPRRLDIPEVADLKKFKNAFNTDDKWEYRDYVITCLLIDTGMRAGEMSNLRLDHCRFEERMLFVTGKTGPRAVPITAEAIRILKGWLKRRATCRYAKESPYVFVSKRSSQLDVEAIGKAYRKHRKRHNLPRISAHTFRHSYATHYLRKGGDIEKLRLNMGHSTYEMLKDYLHLAKMGSKASQEELERVSLLKEV